MSRRPPVCTVLQCSACARSSGTIQTVVRAPIPTQSITLSKGFSLLRSQGIHASIQRQLATAWRGPLQLPWQTVEAGRPAPTRRAAADLRAKTPLKQHSGPLSNVGQFRPAPLPISIPVTGGGFDDNVDRLGTVNGSMYLFHVIYVACHASTKTALQLCSLANHRHRAPFNRNSMLPHCLSAPLSPMHRSSPCVRRPQSHDQ